MLPEIAYRSMQNGSDDDVEVSFMVPCLNEEANVVGTLETIMSALVRVGCSYEILVFDDGSQDNTAAVVTAFQAAHPQAPVRLFRNKFNRGLAFNFVEAAFQGRGTYYRAVPGDNVEPAESIEQIIRARGTADVIVPHFVEISKPTVSAHCHIQALYASRQPGERISAGLLQRKSAVSAISRDALSCRVLRVRLSGGIPHAPDLGGSDIQGDSAYRL